MGPDVLQLLPFAQSVNFVLPLEDVGVTVQITRSVLPVENGLGRPRKAGLKKHPPKSAQNRRTSRPRRITQKTFPSLRLRASE